MVYLGDALDIYEPNFIPQNSINKIDTKTNNYSDNEKENYNEDNNVSNNVSTIIKTISYKEYLQLIDQKKILF